MTKNDTWGESEPSLRIETTDKAFDYWLERPYVEGLKHELAASNLLLVPQESFRGFDEPVFPVKTEEFLAELRESAPEAVSVDICIDDESYKELALHFDVIVLAGVVVTTVVAPIAVNLISEVLKKRLLGAPEAEKAVAKGQITVVETENGRTRAATIVFEGPAANVKEQLDGALKQLRLPTNPTGQAFQIPEGGDDE